MQLPKAVCPLTTTDELCGKDRTFYISDRTHSKCAIHVQIDGTDFDVWIRLDLLFYFDWTRDLLLNRGMQVPLLPFAHKLGTARRPTFWNLSTRDTNTYPAPARPCPDLDGYGGVCSL